jgi:excisionase family DNA binding protein
MNTRPPSRQGPRRRRLVSLSLAATYADVSTRTLRRYISQGRLIGYRVGPRLVKIDLNELDQLARPIPTARGPD